MALGSFLAWGFCTTLFTVLLSLPHVQALFPHLSPTACCDSECRRLFTFLVPHTGVPKRRKGQALPETWIFIKIYLLGKDNFWHLCVILFIGFLCCFLITWITYFLILWYLKVFFLYSYIFYLIFYTEEELNKCWLTWLKFWNFHYPKVLLGIHFESGRCIHCSLSTRSF